MDWWRPRNARSVQFAELAAPRRLRVSSISSRVVLDTSTTPAARGAAYRTLDKPYRALAQCDAFAYVAAAADAALRDASGGARRAAHRSHGHFPRRHGRANFCRAASRDRLGSGPDVTACELVPASITRLRERNQRIEKNAMAIAADPQLISHFPQDFGAANPEVLAWYKSHYRRRRRGRHVGRGEGATRPRSGCTASSAARS